MSKNKKSKKENKSQNAKKELSKKAYFLGAFLLTFTFTCVILFSYYQFNVNYRNMKITNIGKIQENYAKYMVEVNDEFIGYMIEFEEMLAEPQRVFTKEELDKISENMKKQNEIIIKLQKTPPNINNKDYTEVYKDYLKLYAFYIQGEVMRIEYVSAFKNEYTPEEVQNNLVANEETYILGVELCNMMGAMILENPFIVNTIRDTSESSQYEIMPLEEWQEEVSKKLEEYEASLEENSTNNKSDYSIPSINS